MSPTNLFAEYDAPITEADVAAELEQAKKDGQTGKFFKFSPGENVIRILPRRSVGGAATSPFVPYYRHCIEVEDTSPNAKGKAGKPATKFMYFRCLSRGVTGAARQRCPACEQGEAILEQAGPTVAAKAAAKEAARGFWASKRAACNVIDRSRGDDAVPQLCEIPNGLYEKLLAFGSDPRKGGVFWRPTAGYDLIVNFDPDASGSDMYVPTLDRTQTPLNADPEIAGEWLASQHDISLPGNVLSSEEIEDLLPPLTLAAQPIAHLPTSAGRLGGPAGASTVNRPVSRVGRTAQDDFTGDNIKF